MTDERTTLNVTLDQSPAAVEAIADDEVGRVREIRRLRAREQDLERKLADAEKRAAVVLKPVLATAMRSLEEHGIVKCGLHPQVLVSMETERVSCSVCGAPLTPIEVLRWLARGEMNLVSSINSMREEEKRLRKEVDELGEKRKRLRSDIRKATGVRRCRRCRHEFDRVVDGVTLDRCPRCRMPTKGPGRKTVEL